ncbi:unnamed protein product [Angiostrongylus costaricensis]|uniref:Aldo_ket_red domain-containing protein n=1 Tax=Angiostrongylus costaricensis TaxID=334426 RepID=A0A0R3PKI6_ANGCS|nr:unnamed protein product [Angiostrongylus costaricensis]
MAVETTTLSNGASMPLLGLGTWQAKDEHELTISLKTALDHGYRLIDTAFLYQNEAIIGRVLNEYISSGKIKREDLFITTKLPFTAHAADDVAKCVEIQLQALQLKYIDLYLIHCPCPFERKSDSFLPSIVNGAFVPTTVEHMETWRALEKLHSEGKLKVEQLMALLKECLSCSIFKWSGKYCAQIRGLTMGQRRARSLVIALMSKVEAPEADLGPLLYCRYIDNCFVLCSTQEEMDNRDLRLICPNGRDDDCMSSGTVYLISCET